MQIIRQNLFLVIVGGVLVVGAGVLLAMTHQKDDQKALMLQEREKVAQDIRRIPTGGFIKLPERAGDLPVQIKELKARLDELKDEDDKVKAECADWNRRTYKVLQLRGEDKPAFPDVERIQKAGYLVLAFKDAYREELANILASMSPVTPVTRGAMDEEIHLHRIRLQQNAELEAAAQRKNHPTSNPDSKPAGEETGVTTDFTAQATDQAVKTLMLRQATQGGKVYVSPQAMDSVFGASREHSATVEELWQAQANLWVQGDVVQAINDANDESAALMHAKQASVLTSAVRRVIKINVNKNYTMGSSSGAAAGGSAAPPAAAPAAGPTDESSNLTQHCSNKEYDVIQYDFTVVMPARCIPILEGSLMRRNFHTILKVDIGPLSTEALAPIGGGSAKAAIPPYYGPDAVMEVTFKGELLLLTSWERGKYNSTDKKWDLPPLMPKKVLDGLKPALRPEDVDYLADKIKFPANTTVIPK
jgi:hypothetical protein